MAITAENRFHVLAVDDSLIDRKLIERLLRTSSYQVTAVESGSKALEFLGLRGEPSNSPSVSSNKLHQEMEVNLVITDYCMPGMTGYDLLKKIKESSFLKDIPVVIMSSENVPARITRCLEEGAEEFFLKPVQLSDMKRLQSHLLKGKLKDQQQQPPLPQPKLQPQQSQQPSQTQQLQQEPEPQELQQQQPEFQRQQLEPEQQQSQPQPESNNNNNKRKAMDEGLSTECRRPRYNGLTTAA